MDSFGSEDGRVVGFGKHTTELSASINANNFLTGKAIVRFSKTLILKVSWLVRNSGLMQGTVT
jgi:hypothetical protein